MHESAAFCQDADALVNTVNLQKLGHLGPDQLAWLQSDLKRVSSETPLVVFSHIPLFAMYPDWGWGTDDATTALGFMKRFGSVTVLNGHVHQLMNPLYKRHCLFAQQYYKRWVEARSGRTFENRNPANGDLLGLFPDSGSDDVNDAVAAARAAFTSWRVFPAPKRGEILFRVFRDVAGQTGKNKIAVQRWRRGTYGNVDARLERVSLAGSRATALALVFSELLQNALEHGAGTVLIELARRDGDVVLAIADEGSGADGAMSGTGLSIVRALVADELHGSFALAGPRAEVVFPA